MPEPLPENLRSPKPPTGRRWLRRAVLGVVSLALLYLVGAFALSRFLDPQELANRLEPRLSNAISRDVEVGQAKVTFLPLGVRLSDIGVSDPTGLAPELVRVGSVDLRFKLIPLLSRKVQVSRLLVEDLRADLRVSEDGRSNFGDFSIRPEEGADPEQPSEPAEVTDPPPDASPDGAQAFALDLQKVRLNGGEIAYADGRTSTEVDLKELNLKAAVRRDASSGWLLVGSSEGALTVLKDDSEAVISGIPTEVVFDLETDGEMENLTVRTGELRVGRLALALRGEAQGLQDPVRRVALGLTGQELALGDLLTVLPDSVRDRLPIDAVGLLAADLRIEGEVGPGRLPEVSGSIGVADGQLSLRGSPVAEDVTADLTLATDRLAQLRTDAVALGGPLSLAGTLILSPGGELDLTLDAKPDLGRLHEVLELPEGVTTQGQADATVRITGPFGGLSELRFSGNVQATDVRGTHPNLGVPVEIQRGELRLDGTRAIVQDLPLTLGEDGLTLSGELSDILAVLDHEVTPRFTGSVRGARIDLTRLSTRPRPDPSLTYGKAAFAKVGERRVSGRSFSELAEELGLSRPESLPLAGNLTVSFDSVIGRTGTMEGVRARMEFGPSFLRIPEATLQRFGGTITTAADITLAPDATSPFSFTLQVQNLDAGSFLAETTPLGGFVRGRLTLELDLVGTLDGFLLPDRPALVGSGRFSLTDGGLATAPLTQGLSEFLGLPSLREPTIRDWESSFLLEQGKVLLASGTLQGAPGSPQVGGGIGLNGELDLESVFNLPGDRLEAAALERLGVAGEVAANVVSRPDVVRAILRIGGSVLDPAIQADPAATARALGQAVQEEISAEVEARVEEQRTEAERILQEQQAEAQRRIEEQKTRLRKRATGFLQNLGRRPDTARPDTTPPDTIRPDTARPDTTPPDGTLPDTILPDTTRADTIRPDTIRSHRRGGQPPGRRSPARGPIPGE